MTTLVNKPVLHGRDHLPGHPDPIPGLTGVAGDFETAVTSISNLYAYWRLGETASPFADTSGVGTADNLVEHGTGPALIPEVTGALPAGQDDGAVEFNYDGVTLGAGRYLGTAAIKDFDTLSANMTVAAWAKIKASAATRRGHIIGTSSVQVGGSHAKIGWGLHVMYPARTVRFTRGGLSGSEKYAETAGGAVVGDWNLFVGTFDGTTIRLYVNGGLVASTPDTTGILTVDGSLRVGYAAVDYAAGDFVPGWFYGAADEAAVWSRALTSEEVATLYAGGTGSPGPEAVGDGTIFDRHVNAAAGIAPTKIQHPGGTTTFLRGDGTWAAPSGGGGGDPALDTKVWMPLVDSDGTCVLDGTGSVIPTLIPI